ncbi:hypothetical protein [Spirosoma validum]|uniref:Uncharacterized protein n=1 Tax=Spirosoma validum TaxID=2771355 RepID=A0A927AZJ4_9BACT|nr:hypothetical protein [Spirosoma validum]MBD2752749.1 hypothetical protein [Spirosoma validum]
MQGNKRKACDALPTELHRGFAPATGFEPATTSLEANRAAGAVTLVYGTRRNK